MKANRIPIPGPCTRALAALFAAASIMGSVHAVPGNAVSSLHDSKPEPAGALHSEASPSSEAIPWSEIGTKAAEQYDGDGLSISKTEEGALLNCVFQKLEGEATPAGLWLKSTAGEAGAERFRVAARGFGRERAMQSLDVTGPVELAGELVRWQRPGLIEEYSVSVDGVRQDFLIAERPGGEGALRVDLAVTGARAEAAAHGARLVVDGSGRKIAYSRLRVIDAEGRELAARIEVATFGRIVVVVDDHDAAYPVRVDPTFSDQNWVSLNPEIPGANSTVEAVVSDNHGNLYIGGNFTFVGDIEANRIAKWDGTSWSGLGSGVNDRVRTLAVSGDDLYAGGHFSSAGGTSANRIAKWDGTSWSALGAGVDNVVLALAVSGDDLYAGGSFGFAGGTPVSRIAKWDGTSWSALGSGVNSTVWALAVSGNALYAGGHFGSAGGIAANRIAKWDGTSWSALDAGMNDLVRALAVSGDDLYAGGHFSSAGGTAANRIAKWDGTSWSALGAGVDNLVLALAVSGDDLYAGGAFTMAGGTAANRIAKWDGTSWSALGSGMNGGVAALAVSGDDLYAGGVFTTAGDTAANSIAKWDGTNWSALGSGMNHRVHALAVSGDDLYAGGEFNSAGGTAASRIAKWDGTSWSALGTGMNGWVGALAVSGDDLYAGGLFTTAGGTAASSIAKWDGTSWSALGSGIDGVVRALAVSGDDLYAGGQFTTAGGTAASSIAKWDGSSWSALGSGMNSTVWALAVSGSSDLYAGGQFTTAGGTAASYIAKWDGASWSALGSGMNSNVWALAVLGSDLYVGGSFNTAGGIAAIGIAKWDGSGWSALGSGMNSSVHALAVSGSDLFVGGFFSTAGGNAANRIAKWDGTSWSALGSGMNNVVRALAGSGDDLYAGGDFMTAGGKLSPFVAKAILQLNSPPVADAGPDMVIECTSPSGAVVTLDGSASYDPDPDDVLTYAWTLGGQVIASQLVPSVTLPLGIHLITLTVTDAEGESDSDEVQVTVQDTTPPVITLNGDAGMTLECGIDGYTEPGATAADACDPSVTVVIGGDAVDPAALGTYVVTYDATDAHGNAAVQVTRSVTVQDTTPPVITLNGDAAMTLECGIDGYTEPGATAADACDPGVTVVIGGDTVDPATLGTYVVTYDATDAHGNAAVQVTRTVTVQDTTPPAITLNGADEIVICLGSSYAEPGATAVDVCAGDLSSEIVISGSVDTATSGTYQVAYNVSDPSGNAAETKTRTVIVKSPPLINTGGPYLVDEGGMVTVVGSASSADFPESDLSFAWDMDGDGIFETEGSEVVFDALLLDGPSSHAIDLRVSDPLGCSAVAGTVIEVVNVAPTIESLAPVGASADPMALGSEANMVVTFSDPGMDDTHEASWDWGDGTISLGEAGGDPTTFTGLHTYTEPGVYRVGATVTDDDGDSDHESFEYLVVYDPEGGFVTGGGHIQSPPGAYAPDPDLTGKASFGFVSKYKKGANTPTGATEFKFHVADFRFQSTSYEWLVVAGAKAMYKGLGSINNQTGYGFLLSAIDGAVNGDGTDKFRIKIWDEATGGIVYDNSLGDADDADPTTVITAGSIVVHSGGTGGKK